MINDSLTFLRAYTLQGLGFQGRQEYISIVPEWYFP